MALANFSNSMIGFVRQKTVHRHLYSQFKGVLSRHTRRRKFGDYNLVMPAKVSPINDVPDNIEKPPYYKSRTVSASPYSPEIKNQVQIEGMKESCQLAREVLDSLHGIVQEDITTDELDAFIHDLIISHNAYPSPLHYKGFPKSICTSVNNVVCHGIPDSRPLMDGDIVNIDITVYYKGFHGDCSSMFLVGDVDESGRHLVSVTLQALNEAIKVCKPGERLSSIGNTIEHIASENQLKVVPSFAGHGIGSYFHGPPEINHYANNERGEMESGMTFTIEPILTQGCPEMTILGDKWTSITLDGARTAQWEHTVLITDSGVEVLTGPDYQGPDL